MASIPTRRTTSGDVVAQGTAPQARPVRLMGFSVREAAVTPAVAAWNLRTGGSSGDIVWVGELAANASDHEAFTPSGIFCRDGLYFEVVAGSVEIVVHHD